MSELADRPFERFVRIKNPGDKRAKIVPKSVVEERCRCRCHDFHRDDGMTSGCTPCDGLGRVWVEWGVDE
jgi:hypothetical protein